MNETQRLVTGTSTHGVGTENGTVGQPSSAYGPLDILPTINVEANDISAEAEVRPSIDDKVSFAIVMCVVLLGDTARGIFFPTLWTNVQSMGGNRITLGYLVGAFSFGRVMISPYFGNLSTKYGYRRVLMAASGLIFAGAMTYVAAWNDPSLIVAQVVMGLGSGTLGVTRAYVADKSTPEQRTYLLAYTTAVQYAGFTCMPFLGGFLSFVMGSRNIPIGGNFLVLNQFTAPAFFMAAAAATLFGLLSLVFQDSIPKPKKKGKPAEPSAALVASNASAAKYLMGAPSDLSLARSDGDDWPPAEFRGNDDSGIGYDGIFVDSDDETGPIGSTETQSSGCVGEKNPMILSSAGYGSLPANAELVGVEDIDELVPPPPAELCCTMPSVPDMLIYGGFLLNMSTKGTIACFETLGAAYAMTNFDFTSAEAGSTFATFGMIGVGSLLSMRIICRFFNDVQIVLGGMMVMISACVLLLPNPSDADGLSLFMWAVFLMYSVGYPIGHTAVLGLFSKVVGAQPQGTLLGWFGSAGSLARIVFPVIAGTISQEFGTSTLFWGIVVVLCTTVCVLFAFRKPYLECVETTKMRSTTRSAVGSNGDRK